MKNGRKKFDNLLKNSPVREVDPIFLTFELILYDFLKDYNKIIS